MSISVTKLLILLVSLKYLHQDTMNALVFIFKFAVKISYGTNVHEMVNFHICFFTNEFRIHFSSDTTPVQQIHAFFKVTI